MRSSAPNTCRPGNSWASSSLPLAWSLRAQEGLGMGTGIGNGQREWALVLGMGTEMGNGHQEWALGMGTGNGHGE